MSDLAIERLSDLTSQSSDLPIIQSSDDSIYQLYDLPIIQSSDLSIPQQASIWVDVCEGFRYLWEWSGAMALIGGALIFKVALTPAFKLYSPGPV